MLLINDRLKIVLFTGKRLIKVLFCLFCSVLYSYLDLTLDDGDIRGGGAGGGVESVEQEEEQHKHSKQHH